MRKKHHTTHREILYNRLIAMNKVYSPWPLHSILVALNTQRYFLSFFYFDVCFFRVYIFQAWFTRNAVDIFQLFLNSLIGRVCFFPCWSKTRRFSDAQRDLDTGFLLLCSSLFILPSLMFGSFLMLLIEPNVCSVKFGRWSLEIKIAMAPISFVFIHFY